MNAHDGTIKVTTIKGKETVFYAVLPYVKPVTLFVVISSDILSIIDRLLIGTSTEIIKTHNADEALKILENTTVHLIVIDSSLSEFSGLEFIEILKKNPKTEFIPVILMTSDDKIETREKAFQIGVNDFIDKTVMTKELIPRIRRFLGYV